MRDFYTRFRRAAHTPQIYTACTSGYSQQRRQSILGYYRRSSDQALDSHYMEITYIMESIIRHGYSNALWIVEIIEFHFNSTMENTSAFHWMHHFTEADACNVQA
jgi:hypothetical protein